MNHNDIFFHYIPSLGFEVVYVLARWHFTVKNMKGWCLECGRVGRHVPFCWVGSDYQLARASKRCSNLLILLEWALQFSELSYSPDEDLGGSESKCSSLSVFVEDKLFTSFRLPLDFLDGALAFSYFLSLSSCDSICLRMSIDSCWAWIISNCSRWIQAYSSNHLAISMGVPSM